MFSFKPGKLKSDQRIGGGSFGEVFPYQKNLNDKRWVVKVLKSKNEELAAIMQEIVLGFNINHPNLLPVKGFHLQYNEENKEWEVYIKLPRMAQDLRSKISQHIRDKRIIPEEQIVKYFDEIISGLLYLHQKSIAHRDVKPENILLDENGICKLGDCGVGMYTEDEGTYRVNEIQVSRVYTAPEVLEGEIELKKKDLYKADAWSVGMTILELCVLKPTKLVDPFWSGQKKQTELSKYIESLDKDVYKESLKDLLQGLLRKDPAERKSVEEVQANLRKHYGNLIKFEDYSKDENTSDQKIINELKSVISDLSSENEKLKKILTEREKEFKVVTVKANGLEEKLQTILGERDKLASIKQNLETLLQDRSNELESLNLKIKEYSGIKARLESVSEENQKLAQNISEKDRIIVDLRSKIGPISDFYTKDGEREEVTEDEDYVSASYTKVKEDKTEDEDYVSCLYTKEKGKGEAADDFRFDFYSSGYGVVFEKIGKRTNK